MSAPAMSYPKEAYLLPYTPPPRQFLLLQVYLGGIALPFTTLTTGGFHSLTIIGGEGPSAKTITGSVDANAKASA